MQNHIMFDMSYSCTEKTEFPPHKLNEKMNAGSGISSLKAVGLQGFLISFMNKIHFTWNLSYLSCRSLFPKQTDPKHLSSTALT